MVGKEEREGKERGGRGEREKRGSNSNCNPNATKFQQGVKVLK